MLDVRIRVVGGHTEYRRKEGRRALQKKSYKNKGKGRHQRAVGKRRYCVTCKQLVGLFQTTFEYILEAENFEN
jgi:hypothetical protein